MEPMLDLRGQKASEETSSLSAESLMLSQKDAFVSVLNYCLLILISPVATFFVSKYGLFVADPDTVVANVLSAILAVVVLHVALGLFIHKAFFVANKAKTNVGKQD